MAKERRGVCGGCNEEHSVTSGGKVRTHNGDVWVAGWRQVCAGSGEPPTSYVEDPIVAAERRGYEKAIADLRAADEEGAAEFQRGIAENPQNWDGWPYAHPFKQAADYLASLTGGDGG